MVWPGYHRDLTILLLYSSSPSCSWSLGHCLGFGSSHRSSPGGLAGRFAEPSPHLSASQRAFLRKLSRRTWRYFEVFVTADENWLPPDNYQDKPFEGIASRTSPTNIGMALLADLAACDFGYCSTGRLLDRIRKTFGTLARMERHRGHFYNWYSTRSLKPLLPLYVSTVDSGNLVGHLLVLRSGLLELIETKLLQSRPFAGLCDTVCTLLDVAGGLHRTEAEKGVPLVTAELLSENSPAGTRPGSRPRHLFSFTDDILQRLATIATEVALERGRGRGGSVVGRRFERSCTDHRDDLLHIAAWVALPPPPERLLQLDQCCKLLAR